jgi:hypothetical protein
MSADMCSYIGQASDFVSSRNAHIVVCASNIIVTNCNVAVHSVFMIRTLRFCSQNDEVLFLNFKVSCS